jgi:hypothetical protein
MPQLRQLKLEVDESIVSTYNGGQKILAVIIGAYSVIFKGALKF